MPWYFKAFAAFLLFYPVVAVWLGVLRDKGTLLLSLGPVKIKLKSFRILSSSHWSLNLTFWSIIIGLPGLFLLRGYTCITFSGSMLLVIAASVACLFQWKYFKKHDILMFQHFLVYCIGFGIWCAVWLVAINYFIPLTPSETVMHTITGKEPKTIKSRSSSEVYAYELYYDDEAYAEYESFRTFNVYSTEDNFMMGRHLTLTTRRGILGLEVLREFDFEQ